MLKQCPGCGLHLDPVRFYRGADGLSARCQSCLRAESQRKARAWGERRRARAARRRAGKPAAAVPDPAGIAEIARRIEDARRARAEGRSTREETA